MFKMRWVERDTMDKTGTHQRSGNDDAFRLSTAIPGNLSVVHFALHLIITSPRVSFQSLHLTENTCHEKSDFYIIIMIMVYLPLCTIIHV